MSYCKECDGTGSIERTSFNQTPDKASWQFWTEPCPYCQDEDDYNWREMENEK